MALVSATASSPRKLPSRYHKNTPIDPRRQTRLIILLPGAGDGQISCNLCRHDLKSTTDEKSHAAADYEALSYVWSHGETPEKIRVNDIDGYEITPNLAKALRNLRQLDKECRLWVDQICIDQGNQTEKTPQLRLLAKIFGQARDVIVWLGQPSSGIDLSFLEAKKETGWRAIPKLKKHGNDIARAISTSTEHISPWWTRSWVLEEYALAWRDPVALLGRERMSFDDLISNITPSLMFDIIPVLYFFGDGKSSDCFSHLIMMSVMRELNFKRSFLSMAFFLRNTDTKEPHDKVFCIVTSLPEKEQSLISRDYSVPESRIFAQATIADIGASGTLSILALVSRGASTPADYASWVVDFTFRQKGGSTIFRPPKGSNSQFRAQLGKSLLEKNAKTFALVASCGTPAMFRHDEGWKGWTKLRAGKTASPSIDNNFQRLTVTGLRFDPNPE